MATGKTLLEQVQELNEKKQSQAVIDMLSDAILQTENSAQLYAEKAQAYGRLKKLDLCDKMADMSLAINKKNAKANHCKGNISLEQKKYTQSLEYYQTAIDADATYCYPLNGMGNVYLELEDYDNALVYYLKAIELCNKEAGYYHGVGNVYNKREDYPNAIKYYEKAISIDDKFIIAYNGLGIVYKNSKLHEQAFSNFQKAMDIAPDYSAPFFNRALLYEETGELDKAITDYKAYIEHTPNKTDFYVGKATEKVVKLTKMIENPAYGAIIKLINQIKRLLQFEDDYVTHYTGLGTTKILVLNAGSKFRLSEGAFLNDTSEGKELFTYLGFSASMPNNDGGTSLLFNKKPFIGSFVSNQKANDLTLWRMYGKEEKEEAKGCSITIDQKALLRAIKKQLLLGAQNNIGVKDNEMFSFYKVAYRAPEGKFILPGATEEEAQTLNNHIKALKEKITEALTQANSLSKIQQDILPDLNEIVYLFKTVEYQHEQEVRLVFNGFDFEKQLNTSANPPRVFIELVDIRPLIQKITIGPKVERGDEWAAAFYYSLDKDKLHPEICISHLPYK
jgi:tetratricopeptide (TPR) repeat protein